jgi:hypothetical protein
MMDCNAPHSQQLVWHWASVLMPPASCQPHQALCHAVRSRENIAGDKRSYRQQTFKAYNSRLLSADIIDVLINDYFQMWAQGWVTSIFLWVASLMTMMHYKNHNTSVPLVHQCIPVLLTTSSHRSSPFCTKSFWTSSNGFIIITRRNYLRSRDSVVGTATGYGLDDRGFGVWVPAGSRIFSSPSRPFSIFLSNECRGLFPGVKRPGLEVNHSSPASAEVKKMWIYTSTPPYAFME